MSTLNHSTRIVIVDDHPLVREGLTAMISREADLEIVGDAESAHNALTLIKEKQPHLAVVDISLGDGSGLDLIKQITSRWQGVRVLVSSMHDEMIYAERSLQAGAMGYVHKQEDSHRIVEGIRCIMEGRIFVSQRVNDRLLCRAAKQGDDVERSPVEVLSNRELEVFELMGAGYTKGRIADRLHISIKTVDTHRQNIKLKLELPNMTALVHYASQWVMSEK